VCNCPRKIRATTGGLHLLTERKKRAAPHQSRPMPYQRIGEYYRDITQLLAINALLLPALFDCFALTLFRCCLKVAMLLHIKENPSLHHLTLKSPEC
jgi:hypothetical protein